MKKEKKSDDQFTNFSTGPKCLVHHLEDNLIFATKITDTSANQHKHTNHLYKIIEF